jgi:hypothetical protein
LHKEIPVWDMVFNNDKMKKYLVGESVTLYEGLRDEYEYFNEAEKSK